LNLLAISWTPLYFQKDGSQYDRIIVLLVMGTVDKGNRLRAGESADAVQFLRVLPKLGPVAALELRPSRRIVTEPLPQLRAWGDVPHPIIECRLRFAHAARPKPIDKDPKAIVASRRLVGAFQPQMRGGKWRVRHAGVSSSNATSARRLARSRPTVATASRLSYRQ
jgi:hypothetical protein